MTKTIASAPSVERQSVSRAAGVLTAKGKPTANVTVRGVKDQLDRKWLLVTKGQDQALIAPEQVNSNSGFSELARLGVIVARAATKRMILEEAEDSSYSDRIYVADQRGWAGSVYLWPGRVLPKRLNGLPVRGNLEGEGPGWDQAGSGREWYNGLRKYTKDQPNLTFALCCSFAALAEPFLPHSPENALFELVGPTSIGKTTLLKLACSVFGDPETYMRSWHSTVAGLEPTMRWHAGALLALDETGHITAGKDSSGALTEAVFKLGEGMAKARFQEAMGPRSRFVVLSSGNITAGDIFRGLNAKTTAALQVRMITVPADRERGFGIWGRLPAGADDAVTAVKRLTLHISQHHGWAARRFIEQAEHHLARVGKGDDIRRLVGRWRRSFLSKCGAMSGEADRVASKFADLYAAGRLAKMWGTMPAHGILPAMLTMYRSHQQQAQSGPAPSPAVTHRDRIRQYCLTNRDRFIRVTPPYYPELSDQAVADAAGFLRTEMDRRMTLGLSSRQMVLAFAFQRPRLAELKASGELLCQKGLQRQYRVRRNKLTDRLYCLLIDPSWVAKA